MKHEEYLLIYVKFTLKCNEEGEKKATIKNTK